MVLIYNLASYWSWEVLNYFFVRRRLPSTLPKEITHEKKKPILKKHFLFFPFLKLILKMEEGPISSHPHWTAPEASRGLLYIPLAALPLASRSFAPRWNGKSVSPLPYKIVHNAKRDIFHSVPPPNTIAK